MDGGVGHEGNHGYFPSQLEMLLNVFLQLDQFDRGDSHVKHGGFDIVGQSEAADKDVEKPVLQLVPGVLVRGGTILRDYLIVNVLIRLVLALLLRSLDPVTRQLTQCSLLQLRPVKRENLRLGSSCHHDRLGNGIYSLDTSDCVFRGKAGQEHNADLLSIIPRGEVGEAAVEAGGQTGNL